MYFTLSPLIYIIDCSYIYACTKSFDLTGVKKKNLCAGLTFCVIRTIHILCLLFELFHKDE